MLIVLLGNHCCFFKGNQLDGVYLILKLVRLLKYFCPCIKERSPSTTIKVVMTDDCNIYEL